ncbi:TetR/AcrR family transcriptional regulator [Zavarzinia sp.]|uniref:TetR/AcrR family transcriptional regulator n=1 Tax=Zavarzinia sp. TaxID=2027920 RepID=UPI0035681C7D
MVRRSEAELREAILGAASAVFMREGFGAASVGTIAREAGVSTKTIYRFYESKTAILTEVISSFMAQMLPGLDSDAVTSEADLAPVLTRILLELSNYGLSAGGVAANRLAATEVLRVPEMIAAYYREGHEKIIAAVGRWLRRQEQAGFIVVGDADRAAAMLLSMVFADLTRESMVSGEPPAEDRIRAWIEAGVAIFLSGVRRPAPPRKSPA